MLFFFSDVRLLLIGAVLLHLKASAFLFPSPSFHPNNGKGPPSSHLFSAQFRRKSRDSVLDEIRDEIDLMEDFGFAGIEDDDEDDLYEEVERETYEGSLSDPIRVQSHHMGAANWLVSAHRPAVCLELTEGHPSLSIALLRALQKRAPDVRLEMLVHRHILELYVRDPGVFDPDDIAPLLEGSPRYAVTTRSPQHAGFGKYETATILPYDNPEFKQGEHVWEMSEFGWGSVGSVTMVGDPEGLIEMCELAEKEAFIAADCEWRPQLLSESPDLGEETYAPVALLQVALPKARRVFVVDFCSPALDVAACCPSGSLTRGGECERAKKARLRLGSLWANERVVKVGMGFSKNDLSRMRAADGQSFKAVNSEIDLPVALSCLWPPSERPSGHRRVAGLKSIVKLLFGTELDKQFTRSNWEKRPLPVRCLRYAATDAAVTASCMENLIDRAVRTGMLERYLQNAKKNAGLVNALRKITQNSNMTIDQGRS
uniref:3'-5' exonuclease domain-containing protein n=1 Tax=Chromera velia CCMP2878 TaxID=1169474 RepID=A0A0G4FL53_9ALVE|eukprot:Cvel_17568.t1-p1 / transcript=Cvel_17568.t1 / gene=Cvel_17568 / organism=Chromera_velia_CCMP2878 / gene_product=hypothetical protein / transcript_product=hypothetical protein / location=Cvel_scaffold1411:38194-41484(-) / protein_length=485 / sequence_SO=supercontig / SO=protein_coding / is_pseudo=false